MPVALADVVRAGRCWRNCFAPRALSALLLNCLILLPFTAASAESAKRPNIVIILADDLGFGDVGCYGQQRIKTPSIDRLAREGMRFTDFYAGCTVCAPSRCVLMTGYHMGHCYVRGNAGQKDRSIQILRDQDVTVAEVLKKAGYATALCG
jgi:arylsulfatase A-like enzyme